MWRQSDSGWRYILIYPYTKHSDLGRIVRHKIIDDKLNIVKSFRDISDGFKYWESLFCEDHEVEPTKIIFPNSQI